MAALATETITAMTTVFTPAAGCGNSWTFEGSDYNSVSGGLLMQNLNAFDFNTACFPASFGAYGRAPSSIQVYSPGACPSGYGTPGIQNFGGTTTLTCCPENFSYGSTYSSINNFGSSSVLFMGCISSFSGTTTVPARSDNDGLSSTTVFATGAPITMWGQPVTVEYQEKDLTLFGSATTDGSSVPSSTVGSTASLNLGGSGGVTTSGTGTTAGSSQTASSSASSKPDSGLSTGATVGISVAASLGGVILIALGIWFIIRRGKAKKRAAAAGPPGYDDKRAQPAVAELPYDERERRELDGSSNQVYPTNGLPARKTGVRYDGSTYEME